MRINGVILSPVFVNTLRHSLQDKKMASYLINVPQFCPLCGSADIHVRIEDAVVWCNADDVDGNPSCNWQCNLEDLPR